MLDQVHKSFIDKSQVISSSVKYQHDKPRQRATCEYKMTSGEHTLNMKHKPNRAESLTIKHNKTLKLFVPSDSATVM